jgi:hypothetical protein
MMFFTKELLRGESFLYCVWDPFKGIRGSIREHKIEEVYLDIDLE